MCGVIIGYHRKTPGKALAGLTKKRGIMKIKKGTFDKNGYPDGWEYDLRDHHEHRVFYAVTKDVTKKPLSLMYLDPDGGVFVHGVEIVDWSEMRRDAMGMISDEMKGIANGKCKFHSDDPKEKAWRTPGSVFSDCPECGYCGFVDTSPHVYFDKNRIAYRCRECSHVWQGHVVDEDVLPDTKQPAVFCEDCAHIGNPPGGANSHSYSYCTNKMVPQVSYVVKEEGRPLCIDANYTGNCKHYQKKGGMS